MKWHRKQIEHHKELYLQYREKELIWYLDIFLSVNHPKWAVEKMLGEFTRDIRSIGSLFQQMNPMPGITINSMTDDLKRVIGFMHYRQYIHIERYMMYGEIMKLPRVFDLSSDVRQVLRFKLLDYDNVL